MYDGSVTTGLSCTNKTGYDIKQPFGETIDLEDSPEKLLEFSKSFEATLGPPQGPTR